MKRMALGLALIFSVTVATVEALPNWEQKIDPALLQSGNPSNGEYLVILSEKADLSGAFALPSKNEKGAYVLEHLVETAHRTQGPIIEQLKAAGVEHRSFWIDNLLWIEGNPSVAQALAQRSDVARIVANSKSRLPPNLNGPLPADASADVEWNLIKLRVTNVWALGYRGQGVVIGVQDTGYQWDHPALINCYRGWDGTNADHNYNWHDAIHSNINSSINYNRCGINLLAPCDDTGHGTHTMGTIVGDDGGTNHIGVAPAARWIGCRNMDENLGSVASYIECFQWFLAPTDLMGQNPDPSKAPDIINNSWLCIPQEGCTDPLVLQTVVENVRAAGIVVVACAGNNGEDCGTIYAPPAIYDTVLTAGEITDSDTPTYSSSRGPVTVDGSNRLKPNVCAPGVIRSSYPTNSYATLGGTSMSSAQVAGVVALVLSAHPELKGQVDAIGRLVERTAVPLTDDQVCGGISSTNAPNNVFGWGRIDALAALGLGDSDSDGIPDWWMIAHFGHAAGLVTDQSRAQDDPDGDGASNMDEYIAGTDPLNPQSYFHVRADVSRGTLAVGFQSAVGRVYTLTSRDGAGSGNFTPVRGQIDITGTGEPLMLTDTRDLAGCRFYRVGVRLDLSLAP